MDYFEKYELYTKEIEERFYLFTDNEAHNILEDYFFIWNRSAEIKEEILADLKQIETGEMKETDIGADVAGLAYIRPHKTTIMGNDFGYPNLDLPTEDFKGVVLEWVAFLEAHGY